LNFILSICNQFLSRVSTAMLTHNCVHLYSPKQYIDMGILSIRPSVRPYASVTLQCCIETASHIIMLTSAYGSHIVLVFPALKHTCKTPTESPHSRALVYKFRDFRPISDIRKKRYNTVRP